MPGDGNATPSEPAKKSAESKGSLSTTSNAKSPHDMTTEEIMDAALFRATDALPRRELKLVVTEANQAEQAVLQEIELLEKALAQSTSKTPTKTKEDALTEEEQQTLQALLQPPTALLPASEQSTASTPPPASVAPVTANVLDPSFTVSALLGRLRDPFSMPLPPHLPAAPTAPTTSKSPTPQKSTPDTYRALVALESNPTYHKIHAEPTQLLQVYKKISQAKTASVFRRAVHPKDAPGYHDRILFPMDLSLVRKLMVHPVHSRKMIQTYKELHKYLGLICHNCLKFNGRDSDYGVVTREFEAYVDECILAAVQTAATAEAAAKKDSAGGPTPTVAMTGAASSSQAAVTAGS